MVLLITFILGTTAAVFSSIEYHNIEEKALADLDKICVQIGDNVDLQIYQLDTITLNSINSSELTDTLDYYVSTARNDAYNHIAARQHLVALLSSLKGFDYSVRQLNVYSTKNLGYGIGDYLGVLSDYSNSDWYKETMLAGGLKHVLIGDLGEGGELTEGDTYYSISRTYYDIYYHPVGTIEARKYYKEVFRSAMQNNYAYDPEVYIYDETGKAVFPLDGSSIPIDFYSLGNERHSTIYRSSKFFPDHLFSYDTPHSHYRIVLYVESTNFLTPVMESFKLIIIFFIVIYIASLIAARGLAKGISKPIRDIYHFLLKKDSAGQYDTLNMDATGIREIDKLARSVDEYIATSKTQMNTLLGLQQQEIQAEMLALQSQMNPHFLYNSLACIEEMSRQGMNDAVAIMVKDISTMLRAISSNKEQVISIEEELDLCDMYLECLRYRFGENLTYEFDVEDKLLDYYIPKLCIQLLVENAIKSITSGPLPWHICVHGYMEGDNWFIEVIDSGAGFDEDVDRNLRKQMDSILETGVLPSLKIEGMGILNIFIRFYLLDGITFLFDFGNNVDGGAFVKVGRSIEKSVKITE
jgi:sensor histidine kinase YesM